MPRARRTERASAIPSALAVVVVGLLMTVGVARVGDASVRAARSAAVADLTALAAAHSGDVAASADSAAGRVASAGGAELVDVAARPDGALEVTVRSDGSTARAAAALAPWEEPSGGG